MNEALGYIDANVERSAIISGRTTTAGNFLTGLILESMKGQGVVAAFHNCGGMNKDLITPDGGLYQVSAGDIYAVASQDYALLVYELTGEELAKQIANGFANGDYGDQMSGLTFEYKNNGTEEEPVIEVVSITLSDGTKVDVKDQKTKYKVCITNYCAKVPGSVFEGKKPLKDEKDAPIDNQAIIKVLNDNRYSFGSFVLDFEKKLLFKDGAEVFLTAKEYSLLEFLIINRNITLSKDKLLSSVWNMDYQGYDNTVMVHIHNLREKIEEDPSDPKFIRTVKGRGYMFVG